ncbi:Lrp/AsnC ligand binding domain-containing protein, partial [Nocardia sp. NPDC004123]
LAPVVGKDPVTLARRWERLQDDGYVWVTGCSRRGQMALLEIDCESRSLEETASALEQDPAVWILDHCSGARSLLAQIRVNDLSSLSDYVVHRLGAMPGIRSIYVHPINQVLVEGQQWRLQALSQIEVTRVRPPQPPRRRAARVVQPDLKAAIEEEVWKDGRISISTIAKRHGYSSQRVSDALATLRASGELIIRTDIARTASDRPIYTWYFINAPGETIEAARRTLSSVPDIRAAFTSPSRYNLILAVWLHDLSDITQFEIALTSALRGARIVDRSVVMRGRKHLSQIIGPDGRVSRPGTKNIVSSN